MNSDQTLEITLRYLQENHTHVYEELCLEIGKLHLKKASENASDLSFLSNVPIQRSPPSMGEFPDEDMTID